MQGNYWDPVRRKVTHAPSLTHGLCDEFCYTYVHVVFLHIFVFFRLLSIVSFLSFFYLLCILYCIYYYSAMVFSFSRTLIIR